MRAQQLVGLLGAERLEFDSRERPGALRSLDRDREALGHEAGTHGERQEHGRRGRTVQQRAEQLRRSRVGPVEVVEDEHEGLRPCQPLEQGADGTVRAVALVLETGDGAGAGRDGREHVRKLGPDVLVRVEQGGVEASKVLVESVDEHPERHVAPELGARAREHEVSAPVGPFGELGEHARLPDSGLSHEHERGGLPAIELGKGEVDRAELAGASHELSGDDHSGRLRHDRRGSGN